MSHVHSQKIRRAFYLKASVLHEFDGDTSATYTSESNGTPITIKQDFGDTWAELALGGTWKIGGSSLFYADITRSAALAATMKCSGN